MRGRPRRTEKLPPYPGGGFDTKPFYGYFSHPFIARAKAHFPLGGKKMAARRTRAGALLKSADGRNRDH